MSNISVSDKPGCEKYNSVLPWWAHPQSGQPGWEVGGYPSEERLLKWPPALLCIGLSFHSAGGPLSVDDARASHLAVWWGWWWMFEFV